MEKKFRVWDERIKEFIYFHIWQVKVFYDHFDDIIKTDNWKKLDIESHAGEHDKNGKHIYEGDIVESRTPGGMLYERKVIRLREGDYGLRKMRYSPACHNESGEWHDIEHEIIGNKHENAEMLDRVDEWDNEFCER